MKFYGIVCGLLGLCIAWPALAQNDQDLSAGGLAPPEAIESESDRAAREQQTEAELTKAEQDDSGRGLEFFWLNGEIGGVHLGLQTFSGDLPESDLLEPQTGLTYGGGLGLRLVYVTLGARFRMANLPDWQMWTLNAEGGLRIPLGSLEPYFTLGGGYVSIAAADGPDVKLSGLDIRGAFGLDIYLTEMFSLGGNLSGDVLFLSPNEGDGSSIGASGALTLVVGLHF